MSNDVGPARPIAIEAGDHAVYGTFLEARGTEIARPPVLICPPWGWDEIASYRSRRAWSEDLARRGRSSLRIDLPGTGDSGGVPGDPELVAAWRTAIGTAATWLAETCGVEQVAAIGLGLGGLLTLASISDGAPIEALVSWAAPASGRAWVREQRAFAALQSARLEGNPESAARQLPDGWLEVGGFVLSAATIEDLQALGPTPAGGTLRRALILDRDGMGTAGPLADALEAAGIPTTVDVGRGWTDMVFHPEQYAPPVAIFDRVGRWLDEAAGAAAGGGIPGRRPAAAASTLETPVWIERPFGRLFGLLAEPAGPRSDLCAIFLNAGAVRRVGPNRMWVETARRWSDLGVPSIRMDLEGIGDSDGDPDRYRDVGNFYTAEAGAAVGAILDELERRGYGPRFVLVGLCAGGYWAFHTSATDDRVTAALILNPRAMIWDDDLLSRRDAEDAGRALRPATIGRVLRGQVAPSRILEVLGAFARRAIAAVTARVGLAEREDSGDAVARLLDAVRDRGTRMVVAFSGDEPVLRELRRDGILERLDRWPNVVVESLPGRDHTLRPIAAQLAAANLLDREIGRLIDRPAGRALDGEPRAATPASRDGTGAGARSGAGSGA